MTILLEKEAINNSQMLLTGRCKIFQIVRQLNSLVASRTCQISKFNKSIFKIKMVNPCRISHHQEQEVKECKLTNNKKDQLRLVSLKMVNLKHNNNNNNYRMEYSQIPKPTKTIDNNYINNRINKVGRCRIILKCLKIKTIIQKWELTRQDTNVGLLLMIMESNSRMVSHHSDILHSVVGQAHIIMMKYSRLI